MSELLVIVLLISGLSGNSFPDQKTCEAAYKTQVEVNYVIDKEVGRLEKDNKKLIIERNEYKAKERRALDRLKAEKKLCKERIDNCKSYVVRIPFTGIGFTTDHVQGFIWGGIFILVVV
jgi:hypothetical protein